MLGDPSVGKAGWGKICVRRSEGRFEIRSAREINMSTATAIDFSEAGAGELGAIDRLFRRGVLVRMASSSTLEAPRKGRERRKARWKG